MPRDGNGTYTLPAGNPVVSGTTIDTVWANPTMSDLANEITNSLSRNGEGGMLVPLQFIDGNVANPGFSWVNEASTGIYRAGGSDQRVSVNGVDSFRWNASSVSVWNVGDVVWDEVFSLTGGLTKAEANTILANADFGNIGKNVPPVFAGDLDTLNKAGFYACTGATNTPSGAAGSLLVMPRTTGTTTQMYTETGNEAIFYRVQISNVWGNWIGLVDAKNNQTILGNKTFENSILYVKSLNSGATDIDSTSLGLQLSCVGMNAGNRFMPPIKFMSTDAEFTTENPRLLAWIGAQAMQTFSADTTGQTDLVFWTSPGGLASNSPEEVFRLGTDTIQFKGNDVMTALGGDIDGPVNIEIESSRNIIGFYVNNTGTGASAHGIQSKCAVDTRRVYAGLNSAGAVTSQINGVGTCTFSGDVTAFAGAANQVKMSQIPLVKSGTVSVTANGNTFVSFGTNMASVNYAVLLTAQTSSDTSPTYQNKVVGGFTVYNHRNSTTTISWLATPYNN